MFPTLLVRNVRQYWPELGDEWLAALPGLLDDIIADWGLVMAEPHRMTIHWVSSVVLGDGSPGVLKLGVPDGHLDAEAEALRIFDGDGAARLLAEDRKRGAILLEKILPGTPVSELKDDEEATAALIAVGQRLHRAPPEGCTLPHLRILAAGFTKYRAAGDGLVPAAMVERAARLFDELCDSAPEDVVLHGDLHHDNVLRIEDGARLATGAARPALGAAGLATGIAPQATRGAPAATRDAPQTTRDAPAATRDAPRTTEGTRLATGDAPPAPGSAPQTTTDGGLATRGGWLAIDPHGFVGDAGYDTGAMLYNPNPENRELALQRLVPRRIEQLAEHDDLDRIIAWGYVMGVLSQIWAGDHPGRALDVAALLEPRLP
jgi:streptomycin 6-kinase